MEAPTMDPQKTVSSATLGRVLQLEVIGKYHVAADVGQHGQRAGGDDDASDGQPVQPVRQVDGVR
jgi:hypothetical protein